MHAAKCGLLALGLGVMFLGCGSRDGFAADSPAGHEPGVIRIGGDAGFEPYHYLEKGVVKGFDVDIARAAATAVGLRAEFRLGTWAEALHGLQSNRLDAVMGISLTAEREKQFAFTLPYGAAGFCLMTRENSPVRKIKDLAGRSVFVQDHSVMEDYLRESGVHASVITASADESLSRLAAGEADGALVLRLRGLRIVDKRELSGLVVAEERIVVLQRCFAVGKENAEMRNLLDEGLRLLHASGEYERIYGKWFGGYERQRLKGIFRTATILLTALSILLTVTLVKSAGLRGRLRQQAKALRIELQERQRTQALLQSERDQAQRYLDIAEVIILVLDTQGRIQLVNRRGCDVLGYVESELLGKSWFKTCLPAEVRERVQKIFTKGMERGGSMREYAENEIVTRSGERRSVAWHNALLRDGRGEVTGVICSGEDITQRKQAEDDLRSSRERLDLALNGSSLGLWDRNVTTGALVYNEQWAHMLGYSPEEVRPHTTSWRSMIHPDDLSRVVGLLDAHLEGRTPSFEAEYRMRAKSGDWLWVLSRGRVAERDARGKALRVSGTNLDITPRKNIEQELMKSEKRYRALFSEMLSGFGLHEVILDGNGEPKDYRFLDVNPSYERLTGLKASEIVGRTVREVMPQVEEHWIQTYGRVAVTGQPARIEEYSRALDKHFECIAYSTEPGRFAVIFTDVTDRVRAEEERQRIEKQMQQAQKLESLGVLAGGIAHDFNNLLMGILGNASLAKDQIPEGTPLRTSVVAVEDAAKRAADLCRQMLAYSGRGQFIVEPIDLNCTVQDIAHLLEVSISKKALLKFALSDSLPPVMADVTQIRQVLMNLITNASEAVGDLSGVIRISTGAIECAREDLDKGIMNDHLGEGLYVYLEVADTGCGMDRKTRERIFEPFFTTKFTGRGLGLAAALGIVRGHKGMIKVYSEPGRGTTFRIMLPACDQVVRAGKNGSPSVETFQGEGTVLLVDDDETVRSVGRRMLEKAGFTVETSCDGREAVRRFRENPDGISCVVLDLTMPHMDGDEAYREIKRIRKDVPVLISSGYSERDVADRFAGCGIAGFLQKPYEYSVLIQSLWDVLRNKESAG